MKHLYTLAILIAFSTISKAQDPDNPGEYLDKIGVQFNEISKDMMSYMSAASHGKGVRKVDKKRQELITTMKEAERSVRKMRPFKGDHQLRDSVAAYFKLSHLVLLEDYGKIIDLEEIAEQSYDAMEAYLLAKEMANDKMDVSFDQVKEQYDLFAKTHNVRIIEAESSLTRKLEKSGKVYSYYNQVYLVFFKSYKDEAYLLDAFERGDINSMEQTKNALISSSNEGMKKLVQLGLYNYDATLKNSCQQMLSFYQQQATSKVPDQIDFFLKKENFEKIKKAFDAKRQNDRTQDDVNKYNQAGKDYNAAVNKFNSINNELNKKRADLLNQWNKSVDGFLSKHVPKYR